MKKFIIAMVTFLLVSCGYKEANKPDTTTQAEDILTAEQKKISNQIISIFENDTPVLQYGYSKNLDDGRGITAGRAGFTSATADMLEVIERYSKVDKENELAIYIPRLKELAKDVNSSTKGLEGLERKWKKLAEKKNFRKVQDDVVDDYYYKAAVSYAKQLGVSHPFTILNLYDAVIQHGDGESPDSLAAMIKRASSKVGGAPAQGVDEKQWVQAFMDTRRSVLINPANKETQAEWADSVGRVDALIRLFNTGNVLLTPPIKMNAWGQEYTLPVD
jgi:chitosanase